MRIWDKIRRFSGTKAAKQFGLDQMIQGKSKKPRETKRTRNLQLEMFEDRILLAVSGPEINSVFINQNEAQALDLQPLLHVAPRSFLLRFNEGQIIDADSLPDPIEGETGGFQMIRAGGDGAFGDPNDIEVPIGWIGIGEYPNEVIVRFAESLPDDLYQIHLIGSGIDAFGETVSPLQNTDGFAFSDGSNEVIDFELDLGAHITSVVPQPTFHDVDVPMLPGALYQPPAGVTYPGAMQEGDRLVLDDGFRTATIELDTDGSVGTDVHAFTFDPNWSATEMTTQLAAFINGLPADAKPDVMAAADGETLILSGVRLEVTSLPASGGIELAQEMGQLNQARDKIEVFFNDDTLRTIAEGELQPEFFTLLDTENSIHPDDDQVFHPARVAYNPETNRAVLTFADDLSNMGTEAFRLRIGDRYQPIATTTVNWLTDDAGDAFHTSKEVPNFGTGTQAESMIIQAQIEPQYYEFNWPGHRDEPGHRDLPYNQDWYNAFGGENHIPDAPDSIAGPTVRYYNFSDIIGSDPVSGDILHNNITGPQKELARQIFELWGRYLGVTFVEHASYGTQVATGDLAAVGMTSEPGGVGGVGGPGQVLMDEAEDWGTNVYGGLWFDVALHEVGHALGLGHSYDQPPGTIMGSAEGGHDWSGSEPVFPGDVDILHGQHLHRPDSIDIDLYKFNLDKRGMFTAEINAERENLGSLLDSVVSLYREVEVKNNAGDVIEVTYELVSRNDDYFGDDSYLEMYLAEGTYYLGVSASGNDQYDPRIEKSGNNGTTAGKYELRMNFTPEGVDPLDITTYTGTGDFHLVDADRGIKFDGDHDGIPGGVYNYWFNVQSSADTLFVDKAPTAVDETAQEGSFANPYTNLQDALAAVEAGQIVRIVGNHFANDGEDLTDNIAYEIGYDLNDAPLADGHRFDVPKGVTVLIDGGATFKLSGANMNVGSFTQNVDRSGSSLQVLGTPWEEVYFTSYKDETIGVDTEELQTNPLAGDWGGIVFYNSIDYNFIENFDPASGKPQREVLETQGIFLNYVNHANMQYGGGSIDGSLLHSAPVHMVEARPTLSYNTIHNSAHEAFSADPNSFAETKFHNWDPTAPYTADYDRVGPDIYGNYIVENAINGLYVRVETTGNVLQKVNVPTRWDDLDIVHVLQENLTVNGQPGGAFRENVTAPALAASLYGNGSDFGATEVYEHYYDHSLLIKQTPDDGEYFSLFDGATEVVFEFNHRDVPTHGGVKDGRIEVEIDHDATATEVAQRLAETINGTFIAPGSSADVLKLLDNLDITAASNGPVVELTGTGPVMETHGTGLIKGRPGGRLMIDPGLVLKMRNSRIEVENGAQFIAEGTSDHPIVFTSLVDTRYGAGGTFDTSPASGGIENNPAPGDWSGINFLANASGTFDHVVIAYAGGESKIDGGWAFFNPIEVHQADLRLANSRLEFNTANYEGNRNGRGPITPAVVFVRGAQPIIVGNQFLSNSNGNGGGVNDLALMSVNSNSMISETVPDWGRATGHVDVFSQYNNNAGPLVRGNTFTDNDINGMVVRGETLTTESVWDDTDIAHILYNQVVVPNYHTEGGLRLLSAPGNSLVIKLWGDTAGFTASGTAQEIDDRIGGNVQLLGAPGYPVVLTSLRDDSVGAGFDLKGQVMFDTNNDGHSTGSPGDWRSVMFDQYSHDRNVNLVTEIEKTAGETEDRNGTPIDAQYLGALAVKGKAGDDLNRLGYEIHGSIRADQQNESDVYKFKVAFPEPADPESPTPEELAEMKVELWLDIDYTQHDLDTIIEVIDGEGKVLARSDNSYDEMMGMSEVFGTDGTFAATMNRSLWQPEDFFTTNTRDPGMRVVLEGPGDEFYVRVRSSLGIGNVGQLNPSDNGKFFVIGQGPEDDREEITFYLDTGSDVLTKLTDKTYSIGLDGSTDDAETIAAQINEAFADYETDMDLTARVSRGNVILDGTELYFNPRDTSLARLANTSGTYQMQIRLGKTDEVPGSSVQYADIRYATNGIELYGFPHHSPILGETSEDGTANNSQDDSQDLGNLLDQDRNTISVAGSLSSLTDVDWYSFGVDVQGVQSIPGINDFGNLWSTVLDLDYGEGHTNPDMSLWVFDSSGSLLYVGEHSDVSDDQVEPEEVKITNFEKLTAGSLEGRDPFIGTIGLREGDGQTYYVAVTSSLATANALDDASTRREPIDSLHRVVEERVDQGQDMDMGVGDSDSELNTAQRLELTPDEFHFGDVVTYVNSSDELYTVNPFTGEIQTDVTGPGANLPYTDYGDLAMRFDGRLVSMPGRGANQGPAGNFVQFDTGDATQTIVDHDSNIHTYQPGNPYDETTGFDLQAMTSSWYGMSYEGDAFYIVIGSVPNSGGTVDLDGNPMPTTNVMYILDEDGYAIQDDRNPVLESTGARLFSNIIPHAIFDEDQGLLDNNETITGIAFGNDMQLYASTNAGAIYQIQGWGGYDLQGVLGPNTGGAPWFIEESPGSHTSGPSMEFLGYCLDESGMPMTFSSLSLGPQTVEGGMYSELFFGVTPGGDMFAFDMDDLHTDEAYVPGDQIEEDSLQPIFVDGRKTINVGVSGATGLAFTPIDYNLWHRTTDSADAVLPTDNLVRSPDSLQDDYPHGGDQSWYFALEEPNSQIVDGQPNSNWFQPARGAGDSGLASDALETYNLPGGAYGSLTSDEFSLKDYQQSDKPSLYFTYRFDGDQNSSFDGARVYVSTNGANWEMLATSTDTDAGGIASGPYDDAISDRLIDNTFRDNYQHIIDTIENDNLWRQAKVDLSKFAGEETVRLKFVFSTASDMEVSNINQTGEWIAAVMPYKIMDGRNPVALPDGTYNASDSSFTIDGRRFYFAQGYSLYVPNAPGKYLTEHETLTVTGAGGTAVLEFLHPGSTLTDPNHLPVYFTEHSSPTETLNRIIDAVNTAGIQVTADRYVDEYGDEVGNRLYFEGADAMALSHPATNGQGMLLMGDSQLDLTNANILEDMQTWTNQELYDWLTAVRSGAIDVPVPIRGDMTAEQVATSVSYMVNLTYHETLYNDLAEEMAQDPTFADQLAIWTMENPGGLLDSENFHMDIAGVTDPRNLLVTSSMERTMRQDHRPDGYNDQGNFDDQNYSPSHSDSGKSAGWQMSLVGHSMTRPGPLSKYTNPYGYDDELDGDVTSKGISDGPTANGPNTNDDRFYNYQKGQDNQHKGFYIDNIIVGAAERGEMVTGAPSDGDPGFRFEEPHITMTTSGSYQLEIRRGEDYAYYSYFAGGGSPNDEGIHNDSLLFRTFHTNERMSEGITIIAPDANTVYDGQRFTISDGVNEVDFVFIDNTDGATGGTGDAFAILYNATTDDVEMSHIIEAAINEAFLQDRFDVTARALGDSPRVDLFKATDFRNLSPADDPSVPSSHIPVGHIVYGSDVYQSEEGRVYRWQDLGDKNLEREKGQVNIVSNSIMYSEEYGIVVAPSVRDPQSDTPHPGSTQNQQVDNARLVPGIALVNNVVAYGDEGGISLSGETGQPTGAVPFARLVNNTIYGPGGIGIDIGPNASPTLLNNIVAGLGVGIRVASSSSSTEVQTTTYKGNTTNTQGTTIGQNAQLLNAGDPLFVDAAGGNFYLEEYSRAIDSATNKMGEREAGFYNNISELGIPKSDIFAPTFDLYGQIRVGDKVFTSQEGDGSNPFIDRGAIDRVDFDKPTSFLLDPRDNHMLVDGGLDRDPQLHDVFIAGEFLRQFVVQLEDEGIGIDDSSVADFNGQVHESVITVEETTWNGNQFVTRTLELGVDYFANYNTANDQIFLTPTQGRWSNDAKYTITLDNTEDDDPELIRDRAGNPLNWNRNDQTTVFHVTIAGYDFGDAPDDPYASLLINDGPRHVVYHGYNLGVRNTVEENAKQSEEADGDGTADDGISFAQSDIVTGAMLDLHVTVRSDNPDVDLPEEGLGYLNAWFDWNQDGDFADPGEHMVQGTLLENLDNVLQLQIPTFAWNEADQDYTTEIKDGDVYARFRFGTEEVLTPQGEAQDGEVEDYKFHVVQHLKDFGDAPANYPVYLADMGAWHAADILYSHTDQDGNLVEEALRLGSVAPDSETDAYASSGADGDNLHDVADEDGTDLSSLWFVRSEKTRLEVDVTIPEGLKQTMLADPANVKVYLNAWFDVNTDSAWTSDEQLKATLQLQDNNGTWQLVSVNDGTTTVLSENFVSDGNAFTLPVVFDVPDTAVRGDSYARFRLSTTDIDSPTGPSLLETAIDGEVEDHQIRVLDARRDYGDAEVEYTTHDDSGAAHVLVDSVTHGPSDYVTDENYEVYLKLGDHADFEYDGVPSADADSDDHSVPISTMVDSEGNPIDDEDGLVDYRLVVGDDGTDPFDDRAYFLVNATNMEVDVDGDGLADDAYLNVWVDLNQDGDFEDGGEHLITDGLVSAGASGQMLFASDSEMPAQVQVGTDDEGNPIYEDVATGMTNVRFRLSHSAGIGPNGRTTVNGDSIDGEVEDHRVEVKDRSATLAGKVFEDSNANGVLDDGEVGLENFEIYLDINGDGQWGNDQFGVAEPKVVSGADGSYQFFTDHQMWYDTFAIREYADVRAGTDLEEYVETTPRFQHDITVDQNGSSVDNLFGFYPKAHVTIDDAAVVEGNLEEVPVLDDDGNPVVDDDGNPVTELIPGETTVELTLRMTASTGADVWVSYQTIEDALGDYLTGVQKRATGGDPTVKVVGDGMDFPFVVPAATPLDGDGNVNEGWFKIPADPGADEATAKLEVLVYGDLDFEFDEEFLVELTGAHVDSPIEIPEETVIIDDSISKVLILNDDGSLDYGDAPDAYHQTLLIEAGARHLNLEETDDYSMLPAEVWQSWGLTADMVNHPDLELFLSMNTIDSEADGAPSENATGDGEDEDGFVGNSYLDGVDPVPLNRFLFDIGTENEIFVNITNMMDLDGDGESDGTLGQAYLHGWFDLNGDGVWSDDEKLIGDSGTGAGLAVNGGENSILVNIPEGVGRKVTFARFRLSTDEFLGTSGMAMSGEVEDHLVYLVEDRMDYGDAPDSYGTTHENDGAAHKTDQTYGVLTFGETIDHEYDGIPTAAADGDDLDLINEQQIDDEDGLEDYRFVLGDTALFIGSVTNTLDKDGDGQADPAYLSLWVDLNQDGDFTDDGEQILKDASAATRIVEGRAVYESEEVLPEQILVGTDDDGNEIYEPMPTGLTYARFRLSTQVDLGPTGIAPDGEVEDYQVEVKARNSSLSGAAYQDLNANGIRDAGEPGLADVELYLDINGDGVHGLDQFGKDEPLVVSADDGAYTFDSLYKDTFIVREKSHPEGYVQTAPRYHHEVFVDKDTDVQNILFGYYPEAHVTINDVTVVEGDTHMEDVDGEELERPDMTTVDMTLTLTNSVGADVWIAYRTIEAGIGEFFATDGDLQMWIDGEHVDFPTVEPAETPLDEDGNVNPGWIKIPANSGGSESTIDLTVTSYGDLIVERDETFLIQLDPELSHVDSPIDITEPTVFSPDAEGEILIINDDTIVYDEDGNFDSSTLDFGDAPSSYGPTLLVDAGARHWTANPLGTLQFGVIDGDEDGQPSAAADAEGDDDDGVTGYSYLTGIMPVGLDDYLFVAGEYNKLRFDVTNTLGEQAYLHGWIDLDGDGSWSEDEKVVSEAGGLGMAVADGINEINIWIPEDAAIDAPTFARFRLSTDEELGLGGMSMDGEVEDYQVFIVEARMDYGDAPDSYGTTRANDGAAHVVVDGVHLGALVDYEYDGIPTTEADGDDLDYLTDQNLDDEDGVDIADLTVDGITYENLLREGGTVSIDVNASTAGYLNMWVDLNGDGVFQESEKVQFGESGYERLIGGPQIVSVTLPDVELDDTLETYARFRFTTDVSAAGGMTATGVVADGEVEDYGVTVVTNKSEILGKKFNDLNANGDYDENFMGEVPTISTLDDFGSVVPTPRMFGEMSEPLDLGFFFEIGGERYDTFSVSANGAVTFGSSYLSQVPGFYGGSPVLAPFWTEYSSQRDSQSVAKTVFKTEGVSERGNPFIQITWGGDFGLYLEDDPAGDFAAFFYSNLSLPMVYDFGDIAPHQSDALVGVDLGNGMQEQEAYITNDQELNDFVDRVDEEGMLTYRFSALTGLLYDDEPGIADVLVYLDNPSQGVQGEFDYIDVDIPGGRSGMFDPGIDLTYEWEPYTFTQEDDPTTPAVDETGDYVFSDLYPGHYVVREVAPEGWVQTAPANGQGHLVDLPNVTSEDGYLFGNFLAGHVTIGDTRVTEGDAGMTRVDIDLYLTESFGAPIDVTLETRDGTAWGGVDYVDGTYHYRFTPQAEPIGQWNTETVAETVTNQYDTGISGDTIVYEMRDGNDWEIYVYNPADENGVFSLTNNLRDDRTPQVLQVDNTVYVVWSSFDGNDFEIYYTYGHADNLASLRENITRLSNNQFDDAAPQLSQTHVAWLGKDHTDKSDVYLYDLAGLANEIDAVNISNTSFNTSAIQLDGENVVWVAEETGNDSVYLYTNSDHQSRKISTGGSNLHPQIDGSRVVWEHFAVAGSASNWDIALYDFGQGIAEAETTMLQNPYGLDDVAPQIDGDWVVWQANFESESDIYAYNIHHESLENISASNYGYDTAPGLAGDRLVWRANVEGEWEVRYVDLDVPSFIPRTISVDGDYDWSPMISDSMIAWRSHTGEGYTIVSAKQDAPRVKGTLSLNIVGEQVVEEDEHFFVDIVDTQFGIFGEEIGDDGSARIDILNDDGSLDFGDAPASYSTLMADDGARHATELSNLFLYAPPMAGPAVTPIDAEDDGHPSADALGDDQSISIDENGVIFQGDWTAGETAWVSVYASAPGYLNAWVDWNADGNWGDDKTDLVDTAEQIFLGQELVAGENLLSFRVPKRAAVGETYARFRFSSQEQLSFHGSALDGEVEDYKVTVQPGHTDPVYLDGRTVIIDGTALDDEVVIKRDDAQVNHRLTVELNGRQFDFNPADADRVEFNGIRGDDDVTVFGSGEYEYVEMFPEAATIEGRNLQITIENAPGITFYGEGGGDRVDMFDSTDNDTFVVHPNEGEMSSYYYRNAAYDVQVIGGFANAGGRDEAWMYGSLDADRLDSYGNLARLSDQALSYISRATAFDTVYTLDSGGDEDVAHLRDTDGNQELFWANGFEASMTRRGMLHQVSGFETVEAESIGGVGDVGRFYDTVRDDVFIASADVATMYAVDPNSPQGNPQNLYTVTATGFDRYAAISQRGGFDSAFLEDPAGKNHLEAIQKELKLYDIDVDGEVIFQLLAFDQVTIDSGDAAGLNSRDIEDKASDAVFELIFTDEDPWTDI